MCTRYPEMSPACSVVSSWLSQSSGQTRSPLFRSGKLNCVVMHQTWPSEKRLAGLRHGCDILIQLEFGFLVRHIAPDIRAGWCAFGIGQTVGMIRVQVSRQHGIHQRDLITGRLGAILNLLKACGVGTLTACFGALSHLRVVLRASSARVIISCSDSLSPEYIR